MFNLKTYGCPFILKMSFVIFECQDDVSAQFVVELFSTTATSKPYPTSQPESTLGTPTKRVTTTGKVHNKLNTCVYYRINSKNKTLNAAYVLRFVKCTSEKK